MRHDGRPSQTHEEVLLSPIAMVRKASSVRMGKGFAFNRTLTPILAVRKVQVVDQG
jgi:hypothetical protein